MTTPAPTPLSLSIAETGPIPDNQCALKDALLLALQTGQTDAEQIVANAHVFLRFLGSTPVAPAAATPAPFVEPAPADAPVPPPATTDATPAADTDQAGSAT